MIHEAQEGDAQEMAEQAEEEKLTDDEMVSVKDDGDDDDPPKKRPAFSKHESAPEEDQDFDEEDPRKGTSKDPWKVLLLQVLVLEFASAPGPQGAAGPAPQKTFQGCWGKFWSSCQRNGQYQWWYSAG